MRNVYLYAHKRAVFLAIFRISMQCYMQKCFMDMTF